MDAEPSPSARPRAADIDRALSALADLVDLKSPYHAGHSRGVADLAALAGRCHGLDEATVTLLRRAGYVHDIGRIAVSSGIWGRERPLRPDEWERVRMHPYYTHQVLDRSPFLRSLNDVATTHHERLDGSGYYRGLPGPTLSVPARILAAADTYHAKTERRPHREALTPQEAGTTSGRRRRRGGWTPRRSSQSWLRLGSRQRRTRQRRGSRRARWRSWARWPLVVPCGRSPGRFRSHRRPSTVTCSGSTRRSGSRPGRAQPSTRLTMA